MEQPFLRVLRRILNATAFENVGHLRDFEELLQRGESRDARDKTGAPLREDQCVDEKTVGTTTLSVASNKVDRDS